MSEEEIERLAADPRLQAIDVSNVRGAHEMGGMKAQGYWYANDWISTDVTLSLRNPIPPAQRCLEPARNAHLAHAGQLPRLRDGAAAEAVSGTASLMA